MPSVSYSGWISFTFFQLPNASRPDLIRDMRKTVITLSLLTLLAWNCHAGELTSAVVKVFVTSNPSDFYRPWQSEGTDSGTGSGAIITGNRILTNAHVISDQTFIQVKKNKDAKKYTARLLSVQHECDLALLTVDDPDFFKDTTALELGELPMLQDTVSVFGFPTGGDKLSITEGVVSRLQVTRYVHSMKSLLAIQIDAAINPGNSGGPVVFDGKLVGIAMQGDPSAQNIGFMIPPPVITHFFEDLEDGKLDGFPVIGVSLNKTENETMRKYYKIDDGERGLLITKVIPYSPADGHLEKGDVILTVNGTDIGMDGTFVFRENERLFMSNLISDMQIGDTAKFEIIRDGKKKKVAVKLNKYVPLVPPLKYYDKPTYYIHGGLVFTVLSRDFFSAWGSKWWVKVPINLNHYNFGVGQANDKRHNNKVVLITVLPDQINVGYHDFRYAIVNVVNGEEITSFRQFVTLLRKVQETKESTVIETVSDDIIILNNKDITGADAQILERYRVPEQYSEDVGEWIGEK